MVKELVCSDCGCDDVKLIAETADIYRKNSPLYYVWVVIPIIFMLIGVAFWVSILSLSTSDLETFYFRAVVGFVLVGVGIVLSVITFLVNSFCGYSTEARIIAICPNCGKTWFKKKKKKRKIKYRMTDNERDIIALEKELTQLKKIDEGKTEN